VIVAGTPNLEVSAPSLQIEEDDGYTYFVTVTNISDGTFFHYRIVGQQVG